MRQPAIKWLVAVGLVAASAVLATDADQESEVPLYIDIVLNNFHPQKQGNACAHQVECTVYLVSEKPLSREKSRKIFRSVHHQYLRNDDCVPLIPYVAIRSNFNLNSRFIDPLRDRVDRSKVAFSSDHPFQLFGAHMQYYDFENGVMTFEYEARNHTIATDRIDLSVFIRDSGDTKRPHDEILVLVKFAEKMRLLPQQVVQEKKSRPLPGLIQKCNHRQCYQLGSDNGKMIFCANFNGGAECREPKRDKTWFSTQIFEETKVLFKNKMDIQENKGSEKKGKETSDPSPDTVPEEPNLTKKDIKGSRCKSGSCCQATDAGFIEGKYCVIKSVEVSPKKGNESADEINELMVPKKRLRSYSYGGPALLDIGSKPAAKPRKKSLTISVSDDNLQY